MAGIKEGKRGMTFRSRKLLDIAHDAPCMLKLVPCFGDVVACHSDSLADGRGVGHKSHDCLCVPGCMACHAVFERKNLGRSQYEVVHMQALKKYLVWLWTEGRVKVA